MATEKDPPYTEIQFLLALKNGVFMKKQLFGNQIVIHVAAQKCAEGLFQGTVSGLIILPDRG